MQRHFGIKEVSARPMTRADYNTYRGWALPADENGDDPGYLVEYRDGGASNHALHEGYISWSPKGVFERAYRASGSMSFGHALEALKSGRRVSRAGWNGKGMWLRHVSAFSYDVGTRTLGGTPTPNLLPWIGMKTADGGFVPWLASQTDMLAEDWCLLEDAQ